VIVYVASQQLQHDSIPVVQATPAAAHQLGGGVPPPSSS
jgi:hypothetical protein